MAVRYFLGSMLRLDRFADETRRGFLGANATETNHVLAFSTTLKDTGGRVSLTSSVGFASHLTGWKRTVQVKELLGAILPRWEKGK